MANEEKKGLIGRIVPVPLIIEDEFNGSIIKKTTIFLHSCLLEEWDSREGDCVSVTGACREGSFHQKINSETWHASRKDNNFYNETDWHSMLQLIFPVKERGLDARVQLSATLVSSRQNYSTRSVELLEEPLGEMNEFVSLDIKASGQFPVTLATLKLTLIDYSVRFHGEENHVLKLEQDLFSWIELLTEENRLLNEGLSSMGSQLNGMKTTLQTTHDNYVLARSQHSFIVDDLKEKFYQLLNSKKDKIWELKNEETNFGDSSEIMSLNKNYLHKEINNEDQTPSVGTRMKVKKEPTHRSEVKQEDGIDVDDYTPKRKLSDKYDSKSLKRVDSLKKLDLELEKPKKQLAFGATIDKIASKYENFSFSLRGKSNPNPIFDTHSDAQIVESVVHLKQKSANAQENFSTAQTDVDSDSDKMETSESYHSESNPKVSLSRNQSTDMIEGYSSHVEKGNTSHDNTRPPKGLSSEDTDNEEQFSKAEKLEGNKFNANGEGNRSYDETDYSSDN